MIKYIKQPMSDPNLKANVFVGFLDDYGYSGLLGYQMETGEDYERFLHEFSQPTPNLIDEQHSAALTQLINSLGVNGSALIGNYALHDDAVIWAPRFAYHNHVKMIGPSQDDQRLTLARVTDGQVCKINTSPETSTFHRLMPKGTDHWLRLFNKLARSS